MAKQPKLCPADPLKTRCNESTGNPFFPCLFEISLLKIAPTLLSVFFILNSNFILFKSTSAFPALDIISKSITFSNLWSCLITFLTAKFLSDLGLYKIDDKSIPSDLK